MAALTSLSPVTLELAAAIAEATKALPSFHLLPPVAGEAFDDKSRPSSESTTGPSPKASQSPPNPGLATVPVFSIFTTIKRLGTGERQHSKSASESRQKRRRKAVSGRYILVKERTREGNSSQDGATKSITTPSTPTHLRTKNIKTKREGIQRQSNGPQHTEE